MRSFTIIVFALCLATIAGLPARAAYAAQAAIEFEPMAGLTQMEVLDVAANGDRVYLSMEDGTIRVLSTADNSLIMTIGGKGDKWNEILRGPAGMALYDGRLYVTDTKLDHVAVFTEDGEFIDAYGSGGSGTKQFSDPMAVYIYQGLIYVADTGNDRIQVLGPNGVYLYTIGTKGEGKALLREPLDVVVDHRGYIYTIDGNELWVKVYRQDGTFMETFNHIQAPHSLALDTDGIYVADQKNGKIMKFNFEFRLAAQFGTRGSEGIGKFREILGLDITSTGLLYVADMGRKMVHIYKTTPHAEAMPLTDHVPPLTSVSWTDAAMFGRDVELGRAVRAADGTIYVIDRDSDMILQVSGGVVSRKIELKKVRPVALALDPEGRLWVLDGRKDALIRLKSDFTEDIRTGSSGSGDGYLSGATDMVISKDGTIYVADRGNDRVQIFSTKGLFISVLGKGGQAEFIKSPLALDIDTQGMIYILDDDLKSVHIFSAQGTRVGEIRGKGDGFEYLVEPVDLAVSGGEVMVLDAATNSVKVFSIEGKLLREFAAKGEGMGDLNEPVAIDVIDDISFFVSDHGNRRILFFSTSYTPDPPKNFKATGGVHNVTLSWDKSPNTYLEHFSVYRARTSTGPFELLDQVQRNSYSDADLPPEQTYFYRVASKARGGYVSHYTQTAQAHTEKYRTSPPTGLQSTPQEWAIVLGWDKNTETYVAHYNVYSETAGVMKKIAEVTEPTFTDVGLTPDTPYRYAVSSVSLDDVESVRTPVDTRTLVATRPPIEIEVVEMHDIFSNTYKVYERDGIGVIRVRNNTSFRISKLKVSFLIKEIMDTASELDIENLEAGEARQLTLKAVFNNKILNVTEDTPVQTEIVVSYYTNEVLNQYSRTHTINIYEKHKMTWDDRERVAAFVTTKDPVIMEFTRNAITQYGELADPFLSASIVFDALGAYGMTYMQDPANPYQVTSGKTDFVDYLQYPRDTLRLKSGDCDDLVILYSASLESLGIPTRFVEVPGHLFMMFSIGSVAELGEDTMENMFVIHEDHVWVPMEMTLLGKPFMDAWTTGSQKYYDWAGRDLSTMSIRTAWAKYKPANLSIDQWRPDPLLRSTIDQQYNNEFSQLRKIRVNISSRKWLAAVKANPSDVNAYIQLGVVFAQNAEPDEALRAFNMALEVEPGNAALLNNVGNVHYLKGEYAQAAEFYRKSTEADDDDYLSWINLTRALVQQGALQEAKVTFQRAVDLQPDVSRRFKSISLKLLGF